jgi:hypothetical protein
MKLSILDPIQKPRGKRSADALAGSVELARTAERLGYTRYWIVEHHGIAFEANPAPEVFAVALASATSRIRIGIGGVLINHYSPYKAAEALRTLNALFPDASMQESAAPPPVLLPTRRSSACVRASFRTTSSNRWKSSWAGSATIWQRHHHSAA